MGTGNSTHAIHRAGRSGDLVVVRRFLKKPAILNRRDDDKMTCLHWAAQLGQIDVIHEMILADAIELDAQDVNGWTPLMHACCRGHKSVVAALLSAGASVEIESDDGRTALHRAATWNRLGPLDQLIEAGASVNHQALNKWTPLHCASAAGDAHGCAILVEGGADVNLKDVFGLKPVDVVADLDTTELVKRALAPGRRSGSGSQGAPPRSSRPSLARSVSPSPGPAASTSSSGAEASPSAPPLRSPRLSASRVAFEPSAGERGVEGGNVSVKATSVAGVDALHRGSWSRPIGPRPQASRGGSSDYGGGSGGARSGGGDGNGGSERGRVSMTASGWPSNLSQRQVAVLETDSVEGSEAHLPRESKAQGSEADVPVTGRRSVDNSEDSKVKCR